jgi:1-acyl-sn-glycerol-3-phosphate acyltransferase
MDLQRTIDRAFKRFVLGACGLGSYWHLGLRNRLTVTGREHLEGLPDRNVLFVSNHQTYFLDVIALFHGITSGRASMLTGLRAPLQLSFIAAHETMNRGGLLPKFFAAGGAVCVHRTWREGDRDLSRPLDTSDLFTIGRALHSGWLITFPQGTTRPGAPGRRGTAHLIQHHRPVVVPVVLDGFSRAFDKTGLKVRAPGSELSLRFKAPLELGEKDDIDTVLACVMEGIEQAPFAVGERDGDEVADVARAASL